MSDNEYIIDTELKTDGVEKGAQDITSVTEKLANKVQNQSKRIKDAFEKAFRSSEKVEFDEQAYQDLEDNLKRLQDEYDNLVQKMKMFEELGGSKTELSYEYKEAAENVRVLENALQEAVKRKNEYENSGGDQSEKRYERLSYTVESLNEKLESAKHRMAELEATKNVPTEQWAAAKERLKELEEQVNQTKTALDSMNGSMRNGRGSLGQYVGLGQSVANAFKSIGNGLLHLPGRVFQFGKSLASLALNKVRNGIQKLGNAIKNGLGKSLSLGSRLFNRFGSSAKKTSGLFSGGLKNILKYAFGIRSLFVLINKLRSALVDGFKNLAQFNNGVNPTNTALSNLQTALLQLKNSFAAAFAPILQVIEPVLTRLINLVNSAVTALGMLIATLTGSKTFIKATKVQKDYAKSLDKTSKSAKDASGQLSALDELNNITTNQDSGGAGADDPNKMFQEIEIPDKFKNIADWLKEMWEKADFTELGAFLGKKLKDALDSIDWAGIQETAKKLGKSLATLINGFVEVDGLGTSIGKTLGQAINTAFYFLQSFVKNLHWKSIGQFIADAINGYFATVDWAAIGNTLSEGIKGLLDLMIVVVEETDWFQVGESLWTALKNIDWAQIISKTFELIGAAFAGAGVFFAGLFYELAEKLEDWFEPFYEECLANGESMARGLLLGIAHGLVAIGDWIKKNIFDPFINGFKKVFDIHSPSHVMEVMGRYIIEGLILGIAKMIDKVMEKIIELKNKFQEKFNEIKNKTEEIFGKMRDKITEKMSDIKAKTDSKLSDIKSSWTEKWNSMRETVEDVVSKVKEKFHGLFDAIEQKLGKTSSTLTNGLAGIANGVANVTPKLTAESVPHLASGTVVPRSARQFLAVLGDNNNEAEVVSPVSTMKKAFIEAMSESGINGDINVNVYLEGDADGIFRVTRKEAYKYKKRTGNEAYSF